MTSTKKATSPEPPRLASLASHPSIRNERRGSAGESFEELVQHAVQVTEHYAVDQEMERPLPRAVVSSPEPSTPEPNPVLNKFKVVALQEGKKKVEEKRTDDISAEVIMNTFTEALRVAIEEKKLLREAPWYILMPDNRLKRSWEIFLVVLLAYTVSMLPIREAFDISSDLDGPLDIVVDLAFLVDVVLTFVTAIEGPNGDVITDWKRIAIAYAKGWLAIDFLSSFPFALVVHDSDYSTYTAIGKSLKIPRMSFRLLRLAKLMRTRRFQKLFYDLEYSPLVHQGAIRCLKLIVTMLVIGHFSACLWHKVGDLAGDDESWINRAWGVGIQDASVGYQYLASLYWAWQTLATVGYGDLHAMTDLEMVVSIIIMTTGATVFSYVTATISSLLQAADSESALYRENMHKVSRFISDKRLPAKLQGRVIREMGALYRRERQVRMDWAPLLSDMSTALRTEVIQCIYGATLQTSSFLQLFTTDAAKIDILAAGESLSVRPGQYVATYGYPTDYWYLIISGSIAAVSSSNANIVYQSYTQGASLGEIGMFLTNIWPYSLRSTGETVLLRIPIQTMFRVVGNHEGATKILLEKAEKDLSALSRAKKGRPMMAVAAAANILTAPPAASETLATRLSLPNLSSSDPGPVLARLSAMEDAVRTTIETLEQLLARPMPQRPPPPLD